MKTTFTTGLRQTATAGLMLFGLAAPLALWAADAPKEEAKKEEPKKAEAAKEAEGTLEERLEKYSNWLETSFGYLTLRGDKAAFQQRYQSKTGVFGGVEDVHAEQALDKKTTAKVDGRLLFDNHDYRLKLDVTREDLGFIRGGLNSARYYYDGSGGFFPQTGAWLDLYPDALFLDRGEFWVETGLTLKNWPTITLKYTRQLREGLKDSTSWGYFRPFGAGPGAPVRGIAPSFLQLDEVHDIVQADLKKTFGKTTVGAGIRYDSGKNDDARKTRQYPELSNLYVTSREVVDYDMLSAHVYSETRFNPKVFLSGGYSFSTLDNDLAGSRIYGADYDVGYTPVIGMGSGFYGLVGGSQAKEHLVNLNLMLTPWQNVTIVPSLRINHVGMDSAVAYTQTDPLGGGPAAINSARDVLDVQQQLELRYTGITNWVLYARGEWLEGQGDLTESGASGIPQPVDRYTEDTRWGQKYTLGANWYPSRRMHWDFQYYHKSRQNEYDHIVDNTLNATPSPNRYPAFLANQDFTTDDGNVRLTLRPCKNVTWVSRYDLQYSTVDTLPDAAALLGKVESARILTHVFAQNITWVPWRRLYLQGGFNYVLSKTDTPADSYTQSVLDAKNNYWSASFTAGFAVDNKTDLQAQYFYYRAFDNYSDNSTFGVPYGANGREQAVMASLTRRLKDNVRLGLKYGFFSYRDASTGGNNNYDAHLVYSSLQIRF